MNRGSKETRFGNISAPYKRDDQRKSLSRRTRCPCILHNKRGWGQNRGLAELLTPNFNLNPTTSRVHWTYTDVPPRRSSWHTMHPSFLPFGHSMDRGNQCRCRGPNLTAGCALIFFRYFFIIEMKKIQDESQGPKITIMHTLGLDVACHCVTAHNLPQLALLVC